MTSDFIPTRGSLMKTPQSIDFKSVTFQSHKRKPVSFEKYSQQADVNEKSEEFNIKKAKHEIIKFGTSGFDKQRKQEAKIQLAIKLGAKPPKNKYQNYKALKVERSKLKKKEDKEEALVQVGKNQGKSTVKTKKAYQNRKNKDSILDIYGKVKVVKKKD